MSCCGEERKKKKTQEREEESRVEKRREQKKKRQGSLLLWTLIPPGFSRSRVFTLFFPLLASLFPSFFSPISLRRRHGRKTKLKRVLLSTHQSKLVNFLQKSGTQGLLVREWRRLRTTKKSLRSRPRSSRSRRRTFGRLLSLSKHILPPLSHFFLHAPSYLLLLPPPTSPLPKLSTPCCSLPSRSSAF